MKEIAVFFLLSIEFVVTVPILKCMQCQKGINDVKMLLRVKTK